MRPGYKINVDKDILVSSVIGKLDSGDWEGIPSGPCVGNREGADRVGFESLLDFLSGLCKVKAVTGGGHLRVPIHIQILRGSTPSKRLPFEFEIVGSLSLSNLIILQHRQRLCSLSLFHSFVLVLATLLCI